MYSVTKCSVGYLMLHRGNQILFMAVIQLLTLGFDTGNWHQANTDTLSGDVCCAVLVRQCTVLVTK